VKDLDGLVTVRWVVKNTFVHLEGEEQNSRCSRRSKSAPPRLSRAACIEDEMTVGRRNEEGGDESDADMECEKGKETERHNKIRCRKKTWRKEKRAQCIEENAALDEYIALAATEREGLSSKETCDGVCGAALPHQSSPTSEAMRPKRSGKPSSSSEGMVFRASCQRDIFLQVARGGAHSARHHRSRNRSDPA
jgi:hypothetical protein